jgi:hypothetical protein
MVSSQPDPGLGLVEALNMVRIPLVALVRA